MIDVQRLRILRAVAEHGSFNRAAAALHLTPSAVSQQVAALERGLGVPVVVRSTRGVTFTEAGRVMVETATAISAELQHARERIDRLTAERPKLTIATFTSGGRLLLPAALSAFTTDHPEVELHLLEREPEDSLPMVRQGVADLALAYHFDGPLPARPGDRSGLDWLALTDDPLSVVLPTGHRLAGRTSLDLGELAAERWVLGCSKTEAFLRRYAERAGFEPLVRGSTTDYFFARSLVAAGVGVSLVPSVALTPEQPGTVVVSVQPPRPARHIGIATARRQTSGPYTAALIQALQRAAESEANSPAAGGRSAGAPTA
ncbi:LysR family transcriptional regulator [Streptomyces sp. NBC_01443]|uniref:LysR family transcriptional regulator n=1 Tax=Streptomyces sp. NBC_01443 TaxID=2903868 RepID=UPI00224DCD08|nr:LysR family transcriptional regulator [Streptomyces sp. NBC_01443]MCX4632132.1 LysR family transcriptional regulator [Streptomyces sp. NBC_01443]